MTTITNETKEIIITGNSIASIVTEAEGFNDYNSVRFFTINGEEIFPHDLKMVIYENCISKPDYKKAIKKALVNQIEIDTDGKYSTGELIDMAIQNVVDDDIQFDVNEASTYLTLIIAAIAEVTEQGGLLEFNIEECEVCIECKTVMLPDDECYGKHDGEALCAECSIWCEGCNKYYTEDESVEDTQYFFNCSKCLSKLNVEMSAECEQVRDDLFVASVALFSPQEKEYITFPEIFEFKTLVEAEAFTKKTKSITSADMRDVRSLYVSSIEKEEIIVKGYWKDSKETFECDAVICFEHMIEKNDEEIFYYFETKENVVGDHGDFVITGFSLPNELTGNERQTIATDSKESFIEEIQKDSNFGEDMIEVPFGSNSNAFIWDNKTVTFNAYNEEQLRFRNIEDFASWYFNDDESIVFDYQIALGSVEDGVDIFYKEELGELKQDSEEDGSLLWSEFISITNSKRVDAEFPKYISKKPSITFSINKIEPDEDGNSYEGEILIDGESLEDFEGSGLFNTEQDLKDYLILEVLPREQINRTIYKDMIAECKKIIAQKSGILNISEEEEIFSIEEFIEKLESAHMISIDNSPLLDVWDLDVSEGDLISTTWYQDGSKYTRFVDKKEIESIKKDKNCYFVTTNVEVFKISLVQIQYI